jgi:molecular chaperone Hsp33
MLTMALNLSKSRVCMLPESRLYSFLDPQTGHALHFLEGQRLIADLALIHELDQKGLNCLRDIVLALQPLICLLKPSEGLGLYLDIENPYLRFKLETNYDGFMRTLLLPHGVASIPSVLNGIARISKVMPNQSTPYNSAIELKETPTSQITNLLLKYTYQTPGTTILSESSDQSLLILQLPRPNVNKEEALERQNIEEYSQKFTNEISQLFSKSSTDQAVIQKHFENQGLLYLGSRQVKFKCSCSKERMLLGVSALARSNGVDEIFENDKNEIETRCDYCNSYYIVTRDQLTEFIKKDRLN